VRSQHDFIHGKRREFVIKVNNHQTFFINCTSPLIFTSSLTNIPPVSRTAFQFNPNLPIDLSGQRKSGFSDFPMDLL
jgi:hypothetical protein